MLLSAVMQEIHGNMPVTYVRMKGLSSGCLYQEMDTKKVYASDALMEVGVPLPEQMGEYRAYQMYFRRVE